MRIATIVILSLSAWSAVAVKAEPAPLIPRDILFGNPERAAPQLSPDGKWLAYLRPNDKNVLQVWVRPLAPAAGVGGDRVITDDPKRGIRQYFWAKDNKHVLYLQDAGGDENFHLFAVDVNGGKARDLTPFDGVRVQGVDLDKNHPNEILVGLNKRNKSMFDMHRIRLDSGEEKLDTANPGLALGCVTDADFKVRGCTVARMDGGYDLKVLETDGTWKTIRTVGADDQGSIVGFGKDADTVWMVHSADAEAMRLVKFDRKTGKETLVAADPQYDVSSAMIDEDRRIPLAVSFTKARTEWKVLDDSVRDDFAAIAKIQRGDFGITSRTQDDKTWIVSFTRDDGPAAWYVFDRATKSAKLLFTAVPKLEGRTLARMDPFEYRAKDGLTVHGYLTLPPGVPEKNLPAVLLVHGGPWARDTWGYSGTVQWLANRGYAVVQVNFRGSTGYGKAFLNAANREWSGKMHQDLLDAVDHLAAKGVIDAKKTGIMGGSYGGYATLVGLAYTPDKFACGVDIVGPSNLVTLLGTVPPYWAPAKAMFNKRVGDLEQDKEFLEKCSPLYRAEAIKKPLLIGQGANDPRVKQAESDQIVNAIRKNKGEVKYVVYPDEGHGFQRPENRLHFFAVTEEFLSKSLGGRAEPIGEIKGHSGQVK